jgi:hypothetical protein
MGRVVGLAVVAAVLGASCGPPSTSATPPAASHTPAEIVAAEALARAIRDTPSTAWFMDSLRQSVGLPEVQVSGGTATVFTIASNTEAAGPLVMQLCIKVGSLAEAAGDGMPGGIRMIVIAGVDREPLYTCDSPPAATWPPDWSTAS